MNIEDALIALIDTETAGIPPPGELNTLDLLEVAVRFVDLTHDRALGALSTLVRPEQDIPPETSAVHHLTAGHFAGAPSRSTVIKWLDRIIPSDAIICAHHAVFDRAFLQELGDRRWLCTKRLAMHVWPTAPAYNNQVLRYWLNLDADYPELRGIIPHRAEADIAVTEYIFRRAMDEIWSDRSHDVDDLIAWVNSPVLLRAMPFGKFAKQPFDVICAKEPDYLRWLLRQSDIDPDLRYTAQTLLSAGVTKT